MIDTDKYEEIMKHDWLFEEQLFVGGGKWRFALTEYTDLIDMSERDIEEWEEGLEPIWEALVNFVADAPLLLEEVKRHRPPKVDGKYVAWSDSHPKYDRRTWIEQVMEGITDVGYWTWVNWQLQYGDDFANENGEIIE
jgi:hypothetical protein